MHRIPCNKKNATIDRLKSLLNNHICRSCSRAIVHVFRANRVPRSATIVNRSRKRKSPQLIQETQKRRKVGCALHDDAEFPPPYDVDLVSRIIREFQLRCSASWLQEVACAVCGEKVSTGDVVLVAATALPLQLLLPDAEFPAELYPCSYNLANYEGAFLHPAGLSNHEERRGDVTLCRTCNVDLMQKKTMPPLALCNRFYYAHDHLPRDVKNAFSEATFVDLRLIARYSASNICYSYKDDPDKVGLYGSQLAGSQRFSRGNTVVLPRDHVRTEQVLPPSPDVLRSAFTTVFASGVRLDERALRRMAPLQASSTRVRVLLRFLLAHNPVYRLGAQGEGPVVYSADNMTSIFGAEQPHGENSLPPCIEIGQLHMTGLDMSSDVAGRNEFVNAEPGNFYMEACGFVRGDQSSEKYRAMKAECLHHCLSGHAFLLSRAGSEPVRDRRNHLLLGGLFPHLDPFNLGGFEHPHRKKKVDVAKHLAHLLMLYDGPFERDPQFAFVCHNMVEKRRSTADAFFRVKERDVVGIVSELSSLSARLFNELSERIQREPDYRASSEEEKRALRVLAKINVVRKDAPGSNGYKTARRNEIRGLIQRLGAPALFLTVTPTDIDSRLLRLFSGEHLTDEEDSMGESYGSKMYRAARVARNPAAAARSFHHVMRNVIEVILRYRRGPGLFGECTGLYGMVEAQGRGTLHCHMLIWIKGNPGPQETRDRLASDETWKCKLVDWMERHIHCEHLGTDYALTEEGGVPLQKPRKLPTDINPCTIRGPLLDGTEMEEFDELYRAHVRELVNECNWHEHKRTCFSHLRKGELEGDTTCRMGINGVTRQQTVVDADSGAILLRRRHPRINEYNDVMMFLLKCNMDIQYLGSGEEAKAAIYYITDYITKSSLPTHVALNALALALQRNAERIGRADLVGDRQLLNQVVNMMMSKQEMSHQQIMSFYVGGGDVYSSHQFKVLHWGAFDRLI
ncbi:hypothetical protein CALCODRAFT_427481, partial [Calocera cornea HHB12733]